MAGLIVPGSALAAAPVYTQAAHSGSYFGATSTTSAGGGTYEDVPLSTSAGQLVCASAWVRTQFPAVGASGSFVVWLLGGTTPVGGSAHYSGLGELGAWTQVHTCVEATSAHSALRIQFYPTAGGPTVDMDDVDVHRSLAVNGGFENGGGPWAPYPNTKSNFAVYQAGTAHSGSHFAATNTAGAGGGIYEDVPLNTTAGQTVCGSAWVRTEGSATGASGELALWLLGSTTPVAGTARYSGLPNGTWTQIQGCVEATSAHTALRIQFYPTVGSPTVEIDDVDVHESLAANGGFENGSGPWSTFPGTISTYDADRTGLVYGPTPTPTVTTPPSPVVTTPVPVHLPRPKGRRALKVKITLSWTWRYQLTRLDKVTIGRMPGRTRLSFKCLGRTCPHHLDATAKGARRVRRLVRSLKARRFHAGDILRFTLRAPGYRPERVEVVIQYGTIPIARLLHH